MQWTPSTVYIGSEQLPMLLNTYSTISVRGLTNSTKGLSISGTEKSKVIFVENSTTNKSSFVVYGNGVVNAKKIYAEEIEVLSTVDGNKWPDYVFEKEYELKSLSELEQYVNTFKHLPNIPSSKEVNNTSVNLLEMNTKLLEKIEELSLYIIDLQKQINELKSTEK